jgi:hypothetical protein
VYGREYGMLPDDSPNDTVNAQKAIDSITSGVVVLPIGVNILDTLLVPEYPNTVSIIGESMYGTILQSATVNTPLFQKASGSLVFERITIGNFAIKAHASGSTGSAILCTGARSVLFDKIAYLSNSGGDYTNLFDLSAYPYLCYGNIFRRTHIQLQTGPAKVFKFHNEGQGVAYNANVQLIEQGWFYVTTGITTIIDGQRSAKVTVKNNFFEDCDGTAVISGNTMTIQDNWFELMDADIAYGSHAEGTSNDGLVLANYFSTPHTIDFTGVTGNLWLQNTEAGGQTWSNNSGANRKLDVIISPPTAPTLTYTSGETGTLTLVSATRVGQITLEGEVTYHLKYTWTADNATTFTTFTVETISGYDILQHRPSLVRNSNSEPAPTAIDLAGVVYVDNTYNDAHTFIVEVTYLKQQP